MQNNFVNEALTSIQICANLHAFDFYSVNRIYQIIHIDFYLYKFLIPSGKM